MSLLVPSSSAHARHEPLPSPPPSPTPTEEEDLARAQGWRDDAEDEERMMFSGKIKGKGKGKAREVVDLNQDDGESMGSMTPALDPADGASGYPPTTEEEEEEKKIAENLRRWEQVERQRRRTAREAAKAADSAAGSVVAEVSRRASLLWQSRGSSRSLSINGVADIKYAPTSLHRQSSEVVLPLDELDHERLSNDTRPTTPMAPPFASALTTQPENPFEPPLENSQSVNSAVMRPSSPPPSTSMQPHLLGESETSAFKESAGQRPILRKIWSSRHPPPLPLDIPSPKTPPPRAITPSVAKPPKPIPPPMLLPQEHDAHESEQEHRWWTDWLCGCREGPDRGGDDQAGRTNPFE